MVLCRSAWAESKWMKMFFLQTQVMYSGSCCCCYFSDIIFYYLMLMLNKGQKIEQWTEEIYFTDKRKFFCFFKWDMVMFVLILCSGFFSIGYMDWDISSTFSRSFLIWFCRFYVTQNWLVQTKYKTLELNSFPHRQK